MDRMTDNGTRPTIGACRLRTPDNRWSETDSGHLDEAGLLLYRSNLLGSDLAITNFGGGNTSAKIIERDPLSGKQVEILWVKGSGGDLGSITAEGFATLFQDKLLAVEAQYRSLADEDRIVELYPHCVFNANPRPASIDTPLHAYLPYRHIDHVHPDALIALAASTDGERIVREIFGDAVGWIGWQRPGFDLALKLRDYAAAKPGLRGVVLGGHGVICWGETARQCYDNTIDLVTQAAIYLNGKLDGATAFGGLKVEPLPAGERADRAAQLMPRLRAAMGGGALVIGHFVDDAETLEFVGSKDCAAYAALGTSCPDHFLRTKVTPLLLDPARLDEQDYIATSLEQYRNGYAAYYARHALPGSPPLRNADPVIVLVPGVGRFSFAANKTTARLASEFYGNAINVMRGASAVGGYEGLDEAEAFKIEYWDLEEAKLRRMPKPRPLEGRIALVTGAAGGIGAAAASRLAQEGACVVLTDINADTLNAIAVSMTARFGEDRVRAIACDVLDEEGVERAFDHCAREFGGIDIFVANAGLASSAPVVETTIDLWRKNHGVLAEGYFITARAAFRMMENSGGSIIFIGSKNALAASPNVSAYASAKAASLHLARCLALEGAEFGIRVNVVNPDAVLRGSGIWSGAWRNERAGAYGVDPGEELEEYYRERSLLKRNVFPEDIAEAVYYFASDASSKSTGNILNVDAGNQQAFTR